jgi:hypothetical protein
VQDDEEEQGATLVVLDGVSMVSLFRGGAGAREGVIYYPQFTRRDRGLYAARAGKYKAHFSTQGSMQCGPNNTDASCRPTAEYTVLAVCVVNTLDFNRKKVDFAPVFLHVQQETAADVRADMKRLLMFALT